MKEICANLLPSLAGSPPVAPETNEAHLRVVVLIPAYRPGATLIDIVHRLASGEQEAVVVVDDGSGPEHAPIFEEISRLPKLHVIRLATNLGKGSALKTGIQFILHNYPEAAGIITVDADGQHDPADVLRICKRFQTTPDALVLGIRCFAGGIPLRCKLGNQFTRRLLRAALGQRLTDSQTGLRAIPVTLLHRLLKTRASRYEFELEMLIAAKHLGLTIIEQPIRTIYEPGNPTSHFRPFRDSMRIGYVLLRFTLIGILSAVLDNLVFYFLMRETGSIIASQAGARLASVCFNYPAVRRAVFLSGEPHRTQLPRYLFLVAANCSLSYTGITIVMTAWAANVFLAKVIAEGTLFIANLLIQREWIFTRRKRSHERLGAGIDTAVAFRLQGD